jgi:hypothetical protein
MATAYAVFIIAIIMVDFRYGFGSLTYELCDARYPTILTRQNLLGLTQKSLSKKFLRLH